MAYSLVYAHFCPKALSRDCVAIGPTGPEASHFFEKARVEILRVENLLFGEVEVIYFDVSLKKLYDF